MVAIVYFSQLNVREEGGRNRGLEKGADEGRSGRLRVLGDRGLFRG